MQAGRPKTLPAAIVPVWLGCVLAFEISGQFNSWLAICTLGGAIFIQLATNFFNDVIDTEKGADTENRAGPKRVTASGELSKKTVYTLALGSLGIASIFGYWLIVARGWPMVAIGIPSFYLAYGYTGGPLPLAYRGLGELFVLLFFGWIAVMGTVFVQIGEWHWEAFLLGTQVGLLSAVLILVNNIRDCDEDSTTGKHTIAVLLGQNAAWMILLSMTILVYSLGFFWIQSGEVFAALLPILSSVLGVIIVLGVKKAISEGKAVGMNKFLAVAALQLLVFAGLWTVAVLV